MRYAHIFCGWSKRPKPNEIRRAFIRRAYLCFAAARLLFGASMGFGTPSGDIDNA